MKKLLTVLLSVMVIFSLAGCSGNNNGGNEETVPAAVDPNAKSEGVMTYAEYVAAEDGSDIVIEGFVQASAYNETYGNVNLFLQDGEGAYYVYRMNVSSDEAAQLTKGTKIKVSGQKGSWAGEIEVAEGTGSFEVSGEDTYVPEAVDVTAEMGTDSLIEKQNMLVVLKDVKVAESVYEEKDDKGNVTETHSDAFWYGWENSSEKGSNADIYFNVEINGTVYNIVVESDECPEGSDVYSAAEALNIGDTVDVTGYLYWYNGPNVHVHGITVK